MGLGPLRDSVLRNSFNLQDLKMGSRGVRVWLHLLVSLHEVRGQSSRPTLTMTAGTLSPHTRPWPFFLPSSGAAPASWASKAVVPRAPRGLVLGAGCWALAPASFSSTWTSDHLSSLELCCSPTPPTPRCPQSSGLGYVQGLWVTVLSHMLSHTAYPIT